nr:MAG TPA: hypothetical protein [Caudoviricetes sp.]
MNPFSSLFPIHYTKLLKLHSSHKITLISFIIDHIYTKSQALF